MANKVLHSNNIVWLLALMAILLGGCAAQRGYLGNETIYYDSTQNTLISCREPAPYPGGNCQRIADWATNSASE